MVGEALLWKLQTRQQFEDDVTDDHCKLTPKESLLSASSVSRKTQGCYAPLYKSKTVFTRLPFTHKSIKCTSTELSLKKNKQPEPTSHQISEFGFTFPEQRCDQISNTLKAKRKQASKNQLQGHPNSLVVSI